MAVEPSNTTRPLKERASLYLYFGSLYFVLVGVLYLWGYWSPFGIDIMQYVTLSDVAKLAVYPVASTFASFAIGVVVSFVWPGLRGLFPPGGGRDTPTGRVLDRLLPLLTMIYALGTIALLVFGPVTKWIILPGLIAMPISVFEQRRGLLRFLWPNEAARTTVIFLLAAMPVWAYGQGRLRATAILDGSDYYYLSANTIDSLPLGNVGDPKSRVKYLGQVNDYIFLLLPDNATSVIVRFDRTRGLQLKRFRASASPPAKGRGSGT